jgi:hypothetical protein
MPKCPWGPPKAVNEYSSTDFKNGTCRKNMRRSGFEPKNNDKIGKYIKAGIYAPCFVSCSPNSEILMHSLLLNAFFDAGETIGPVLAYVFIFLMTISLIYVMAKYLGSKK